MLFLKLLLVPTSLFLVSLSGKRWGPKVAGWLAGFPLVGGPILLLLALDRGPDFAAQAAVLSVSAIFASEVFSFAYAWGCKRHAWPSTSLLSVLAWLAAVFGLSLLPPSIAWATGVAALAVLVSQCFLPRSSVVAVGLPLSYGDLAIRMAAGGALTLLVTGLASTVGAKWSGLLAAFPLLGSVLCVSSHRAHGHDFVLALIRGMVLGRFSFAAFCLTLAVLLPTQGIALAFSVALILSAVVQWGARMMAALGSAIVERTARTG